MLPCFPLICFLLIKVAIIIAVVMPGSSEQAMQKPCYTIVYMYIVLFAVSRKEKKKRK